MHNVELLAPARNLYELKENINAGANAIYLGGEVFGMKSIINSFSKNDLEEGIRFAHEKGAKLYIVVNILPHDEDFNEIKEYIKKLEELKVDAIVISDPGMLSIIKEISPEMEIHLSDQANTTNYLSAMFWYNNGVNRISVPRELSCDEIGQMRAKTPLDMDIEVFVHGVMTISYSGRPLLKNFINSKDQKVKVDKKTYRLMEEKRPGEYFPVYEDEKGTFLFNSKDLCMLENIPELIKAGVTSLKIEGRMKEFEYINEIVKAYKIAIDEFYKKPEEWKFNPMWLDKINNTQFTSGFYFDNPND